MTRFLLAAGTMLSAISLVSPALADPRGANLGGGFLELIMTGRNPSPRQQAVQPQPQYQARPQYQAQPIYQPGPPPVYGQSVPERLHGALSGIRGQQEIPMEPQVRTRPQHAALAPDTRQVERELDPRFLPQEVDYDGPHKTGTVVIDTPNKFLYLVEGNGRARRYGIGVGRPGFEWAGVKSITRKAEWPDWRPPAEMLKRRPDLPRYMAGGPENPMGARGLYLGSSLYRIHGTNEPHTIGQAVSSGCIRMRNEDVTDFYERVKVGTKVIVM
jgi:lipoprotein-anchoring transpeptidase ErfK/SrfK